MGRKMPCLRDHWNVKQSWQCRIRHFEKLPSWTQTHTHWSGPENTARVNINDEGSWALLDSGSTINVITPEFVKACALDVGPLSNLVDSTLKINWFGGLFSWLFGYVIIRVQVEGVKGYNEDQVALVIPDSAAFQWRVLIILGTSTINQIMNIIREQDRWAIFLTEWIMDTPPTGRTLSRTLP